MKKILVILSLFPLATCTGNFVVTDNQHQNTKSIYLIPSDHNSVDPNSKNIIQYVMSSS